MAEHHQELIDFSPPWKEENTTTIKDRILPQILPADILKRDDFERSLKSLVDYAVKKDKQTKNFSINIAYYIPNFNEKTVKEEEIWGRDNIWVKIRIKGGAGKYFRSRYMATQIGVARVDWKRKTFRSLKVNSVKVAKVAVTKGLKSAISSATNTVKEDVGDEEGEAVGDDFSETIKETSATFDDFMEDIKEGAKERASLRMHSITRSKEDMRTLLGNITTSDLATIYRGAALKELIKKTFASLGDERGKAVPRHEFLLFWHFFLHESVVEAVHLCEEQGGDDLNIDIKQFVDLFKVVMENHTGIRPLEPLVATKPNKARALVLEFLLKPSIDAQLLLASESDFDSFAKKMYEAIDERETGAMGKSDFMQFFSSVLDVPAELAFESFQKVSGLYGVVTFFDFKTYLKQFLAPSADPLLLWTWIVNDWMTNKTEEELTQLQSDVTALGVISNKLLETVHA